ncbi:MAG: hypothetical protein U0324_42165 [Polyangiales bacterium]
MAKRASTAAQSPTPAAASEPAVITVTIGRDAANQAGVTGTVTHETLESLCAKHGAPSPALRRVVFSTFDPEEGLALGRKVATERILAAVPGFAQNVVISWEALPPERRAKLIGFQPAMVAVLLDETASLRDVNRRYDARARANAMGREARDADAREALRAGRAAGEHLLRVAQRWAPAAYLTRAPLPGSIEGAQNPDALANTLDTLASWLAAWRATWGDDDRAVYEGLRFAPELPKSLHDAATRIRDTQDVLAAAADTMPASQRELDVQDGRVLHVVELIHGAFQQAARNDAQVVAPDLGELTSVFERAKAKTDAKKTDAKKTDEPDAKKTDGDPR